MITAGYAEIAYYNRGLWSAASLAPLYSSGVWGLAPLARLRACLRGNM